MRSQLHGIFKYLTEIVAVQTAAVSDIVHENVVLKILLDECDRFVDIEVSETAALGDPHRRDGGYGGDLRI